MTNLPLSGDEPLTFEQHIRPILKAHCFHCHGEEGVKESGLDLRLKRFMVTGGETGPAIQPGSPSKSILVEKIESGEMPPEDKNVPDDEIELIKRWIQEGAKTNRNEPATINDEYISDEEKAFWSFQPIANPKIPSIGKNGQVENQIDAFVLARLTARGLTFSEKASKETLIRRLYFDLIGLPPSPAEVKAFVEDTSSDAVERLVDQLLVSPHYGERWGRHWLDVSGYADSEGYTDKDPEREFAFFFRDYVIQSFNDGKAFDEFIVEQLAGDELVNSPLDNLSEVDRSRLMATGFLRMAPDGSASGGVDRAVSANETIADTINIVSTSLLGLTVGCARCHNHRYDPITQVDYYRLRAVFEPALDWKAWKTPSQRRVSLYTEEEKAVRSKIEAKAKKVEAERTKKQTAHIERTLYEELLVAPDNKRDLLRAAYKTPKNKRTKEQIALLEEYPNIQNISTGSLYLYAEQRGRRANEILAEGKRREVELIKAIQAREMMSVSSEDKSNVENARKVPADKRTEEAKKWVSKYPGVFVDSKTLHQFDKKGAARIEEYKKAAERCRKTDAKTELANMAAEATKIRSTAPREFFVRALVEPANHQPDTFLFRRGNHNSPGQKVPPGELTVLNRALQSPIALKQKDLKSTGRRLAYARHLTNGKHPLVARVIVNRIWMHHFGKGLVETTGDFGFLGEKPTHPKLLDWLATELMNSGWNLKTLQRKIVLSHTYRQSSLRTEKLDDVDPSNQLYARQNMKRLESEVIRDSVLSVSGMLVNKMNGPPIPVKEDAVGQIVLGKQKLDGERKPQPGNKLGGDAERRSVYIQVRRTRPLAVLESFDIATNSPNCNKRHYSNVAPQSLMLMNSEFMVRYSEKMSRQIQATTNDLNAQISLAFELAYSKPIESEQVSDFVKFVKHQQNVFRKENPKLKESDAVSKALANLCHAFLCSNEFIYVD